MFVAMTAPAQESAPLAASPPAAENAARAVKSVFDVQVELHRRGFSCGAIDGVMGAQTAAAMRAFQRSCGLPETGALDPETSARLPLTAPVLATHTFTAAELGSLQPVPPTWLEKSQLSTLAHASALEFVSERYRASQRLIRRLNPDTNWDAIQPGTIVSVPAVERATFPSRAARIAIRLEARELKAFDAEDRLIAHFPVSIARLAEKRPVGELRITVIVLEPNYTFDPAVYPESEEAKQLGRKLIVPPGPNNPVGRAWIGLNLSGYGIHGTPDPEKVGRTESHGCFRLANWDAISLANLAAVGMSVTVEP
jgi:lipoprotein-anchoring transpeptidase ErfK/SrfK